jgi:hypothetical protein
MFPNYPQKIFGGLFRFLPPAPGHHYREFVIPTSHGMVDSPGLVLKYSRRFGQRYFRRLPPVFRSKPRETVYPNDQKR